MAPILIGASIQPSELLNTGIISVEDFAEVSGNHTDVEIQAALDYAKTNNKNCIYITGVTWTINNQINLTWDIVGDVNWEGVYIIGSGIGYTYLECAVGVGVGDYVFYVDYQIAPVRKVDLVSFSKIHILGNVTAQGGIYAEGVGNSVEETGFYMEFCSIRGFTVGNAIGVLLFRVFHGDIKKCTFRECAFGFSLNRSNLLDFSNCRFLSCTSRGLLTTVGSYANLMTNCLFESNLRGAEIGQGKSNVFDSCYFENNTQDGIRIINSDEATYPTRGTVVKDSYFDGLNNAEFGINCGAPYTTIEGNTFRQYNTASIAFGQNAGEGATIEWCSTKDNYTEDITFVNIGNASTCEHIVITEKVYIDKITDAGNYTIWPDMEYKILQNNSGGAVEYGDVVIWDSANDRSITTTAAAQDAHVAGVVYDVSTADTVYCAVVTQGQIGKIKVDGTIDIAVDDLLETFTAVKIARKGTVGSGACFAIAMEAYTNDDSNGEIKGIVITSR